MKEHSTYDLRKDKVLAVERGEGSFGLIEVAKKQYDGGPEKYSLMRVRIKQNGDEIFMPLGRLTKQECDVLVQLLMKVRS